MPVLRRRRPQPIDAEVNPLTRVSPHFLLSDFLGNYSVYSEGIANGMKRDPASLRKMDNLGALANNALEVVLKEWGPLSISYGYIAPETSRRLVTYQDPDMPSHHRFDLGAAADICVHRFVQNEFVTLDDLFLPESARSAPIALAHGIDMRDIPYSRLITYSESPYICLAVSSDEVGQGRPRKAFYENRYQGRKGAKPEYIQLSSQNLRNRHFAQLQEQGLEHDWRGHGYPTYHGKGRYQYHHRRVSKYTMVSDWLLDLQSISTGAQNAPALGRDVIQDSFAAAGMVYDKVIDLELTPRMSIIGGFVSHLNPHFNPENDWRTGVIEFTVVPHREVDQFAEEFSARMPPGVAIWPLNDRATIRVTVEDVLQWD